MYLQRRHRRLSDFIDVADLPEHLQRRNGRTSSQRALAPLPLDGVRRMHIERVLDPAKAIVSAPRDARHRPHQPYRHLKRANEAARASASIIAAGVDHCSCAVFLTVEASGGMYSGAAAARFPPRRGSGAMTPIPPPCSFVCGFDSAGHFFTGTRHHRRQRQWLLLPSDREVPSIPTRRPDARSGLRRPSRPALPIRLARTPDEGRHDRHSPASTAKPIGICRYPRPANRKPRSLAAHSCATRAISRRQAPLLLRVQL